MDLMSLYGTLINHYGLAITCIALIAVTLGYIRVPFVLWAIVAVCVAFGFGVPVPGIIALAVFMLTFVIKPIRKIIFSKVVMKILKGIMPKISDTERTALEAGVVWVEADLFSGKPDFFKLMKEPYAQLTQEEQDFLDGPVDELCALLNDWEIWRQRKISDEAFDFIKEKGFLGMIIPKEFGGLGFSATAHGNVIAKISTRSITAGITVMVPNSLGPAELLIHYGTEAQKKLWLPKLATGEVIPCFGLTEPNAGSDAGSIQSRGDIFKGDDGRLKIRLNWNKRWITLAAISDVIGLAFKLYDKDNLLGRGEELGITCALVPSKAPGVVLGQRHDPLNIPFYNCPTQGKDVVVDAEDAIIGGTVNSGLGWKMLMECLGAGRGVSLPSQSAGGLKLCVRVIANHAMIRKQFGTPIGYFEGVQEPISRVITSCYYVEAMRRYTLGALDRGIKPPVITAIAKYHATEAYRRGVNDSMDVMGGQGISMGPRNMVGQGYVASPISITVEGANILTRTLIIFGQGALRAHPYAFKEFDATAKNDLDAFDQAFWAHVGHIARNKCRALVLSLTRGMFAVTPGNGMRRYYQKLTWASASFAFLADVSMGLLGGKLKIKEKLTGRFADILSWMFIGTSILRRFEAEGLLKEDLPIVRFAMDEVFRNIQMAFDGIYANFDVPIFGWFFKGPVRLWSRINRFDREVNDKLGGEVVKLFFKDSPQRDRLTEGIYIPKTEDQFFCQQETTFKAVLASMEIGKKIRKAIKAKIIDKKPFSMIADEAVEKGIISSSEKEILLNTEKMRNDTIQVDHFSEQEFMARS